jgi:DNA topoisomerase-6 subunit B
MADPTDADTIFKEFKEHSIAEFFKKNRQMLGYSGKVRSLTTIVHEYVTNSMDATEEAGILPEISVDVRELGEDKYSVAVTDNGPGIPKSIVGKAMATVLAGTKFHRYMQQRGQQGIGAASCTLFSLITTNKPIHVKAGTSRDSYECDISIDTRNNKPIITNAVDSEKSFKGFSVHGEFGDVKYEGGDHGIYEYLKRTALANPHVQIKLHEPDGNEILFPRSASSLPKRPKEIKPHPLGINASELLEFAQASQSRKISSFLIETFSRFTQNKVDEIKQAAHGIDLEKEPRHLKWEEAEQLVKVFKSLKWVSPELDSLSMIGEEGIAAAIKNILNPQFVSVSERKPRIFRGGVPFVVETGIAYGGGAGKKIGDAESGSILRFANKVPLLFDGSACAITDAVRGIDWKRYGIQKFDEEPVSVMVNVSSVYIPYSGVGKQAVSKEEEIIEEIKLSVQEAGRGIQRYISGVRNRNIQESKYKIIMRYISQLSGDLSELTGTERGRIEESLKELVDSKYRHLFADEGDGQGAADSRNGSKDSGASVTAN